MIWNSAAFFATLCPTARDGELKGLMLYYISRRAESILFSCQCNWKLAIMVHGGGGGVSQTLGSEIPLQYSKWSEREQVHFSFRFLHPIRADQSLASMQGLSHYSLLVHTCLFWLNNPFSGTLPKPMVELVEFLFCDLFLFLLGLKIKRNRWH